MNNKAIILLVALFAAATSYGQQFKASAASSGSLSNHYDYTTTPYTQIDSRISTSMPSGFTSPATLTTLHFEGKDYAGFNIGQVQFGTGSFLSGSLSDTALFTADQSYVLVSANGSCGIFKADGVTCKNNGYTPNTATMFVGVFLGNISWQTLADNSHILKGVVKGIIDGKGDAKYMSFTATTVVDSNPFAGNGHLDLNTITIQAFDSEGN